MADAAAGFAADAGTALDGLRARGAARFDPVRFRFVEALGKRAGAFVGPVREALEARLREEIDALTRRFNEAECEAQSALAAALPRFPDAGEALRRHCEAGDFAAFRRCLVALEHRQSESPLTRFLAQLAAGQAHRDRTGPSPAAHEREAADELGSLQYFRDTWSRLNVDRQLAQAFAQAPENAGPLNSHHLVLRSLKLMRELSPHYLEHFVTYAEALLWLDQADTAARTPGKKPVGQGEGARKRKPRKATPEQ